MNSRRGGDGTPAALRFRREIRGIPPPGVPLFSCPICGWTTTASLAQAVRAHELGVPDCEGVLRRVAYGGEHADAPLAVGDCESGGGLNGGAQTHSPEP